MRALLRILAVFFEWFFSPKRTQKREAAATEKSKGEVESEVRRKDTDAVNARLDKLLLVCLLPLVFGCASRPKTVYIPAGDKVLPLQYEGRDGWWVPEAVFIRMVQKLEEAKR